MNVTRGLLTVLSLLSHTESRCSPTSYYKNCWIRRFPGFFIDIEESQRRGAQLMKFYQEETALKCSRACCLTRNFSCNLAVFHYDTTQENCFHLHCPTLESCILSHRGNVVLYNITKGVDPDLLVFGNHFTSNVRVLPHHYGRGNASEPLPSDKRQFIHPPPPPAPPLTSAATVQTPGSPTATQHSAARPSTLHATTVPVRSTPEAPLASGNHAQTTTTTTTTNRAVYTTSLAAPPPPSTAHTSGSYDPETSAASSAAASQPSAPATSSGPLPTSPAPVASAESGGQSPNDTGAGPLGNHTAGSGAGDVGEAGAGWHAAAAAHTLLVAVAVCVAVAVGCCCCCCCSVLLVVSWRGQRKRMGCYRASWRGRRGSTRLIKYVLVRENT